MNKVKSTLFMALAILFVFATSLALAEDKVSDEEIDAMFQALDKNHDDIISREEWNAVDTNKDGEITPNEWQRYHFNGSRSVKWIDTNGDGLMDRHEFLRNFR